MRKFPWMILLCVLTAVCVMACGGKQNKDTGAAGEPEKPPAETVLSGDKSLVIETVGGVAVTDGRATMTTAQYEAFVNAADKKSACTYTLADKASLTVAMDGFTVTFTVTAEDGTTEVKAVELDVLSDDCEFTVTAFYGKDVRDGAVVMTEREYREFVALDCTDVGEYAEVVKADGAKVTAKYVDSTQTVNFRAVSEDGSTQKLLAVELKVTEPFGTHSDVSFGQASGIAWDRERKVYRAETGAAATIKQVDGSTVKDCYYLSLDATFDRYTTDGEMVFYSYETSNLMIRFYIRFTDSAHYSVRSDYRDMSDYKNEQFLNDNVKFTSGQYFNVCLINIGNELVMQYDGETLYRRVLPDMTHSEPAFSTYKCSAMLKNISVVTDESKVRAARDKALENYDEKPYGKTLLGSSENLNKIAINDDGTVIMNNASSDSRIMAAPYENGVPVGGLEYAVGGKHEQHQNVGRKRKQSGIPDIQFFSEFYKIPLV